MEILNFKLRLFQFMTILAVSIILISCGQDDFNQGEQFQTDQDDMLLPNEEIPQETVFMFPKGVSSDEDVQSLFENMEQEAIYKLIENYRIYEYLNRIGKFEKIHETLVDGTHLADIDLSNYLTAQELLNLESHDLTSAKKANAGNSRTVNGCTLTLNVGQSHANNSTAFASAFGQGTCQTVAVMLWYKRYGRNYRTNYKYDSSGSFKFAEHTRSSATARKGTACAKVDGSWFCISANL